MNENLDTMTIEIEQEMYDQMSKLCQNLGTTIEDMAACRCGYEDGVRASGFPESLCYRSQAGGIICRIDDLEHQQCS